MTSRITPEERAAQIRRKLEAGVVLHPVEAMRNSGRRRTPDKREMLRQVEELARQRGQVPWPARY